MATVIAEIEVCDDCAQIIANGEINDGTDQGERTAAAQTALWGADAIGLVLAGDEDGEPSFGTAPCGGCGTDLAGDRHPAAVLR